jgi:hypothetical protein
MTTWWSIGDHVETNPHGERLRTVITGKASTGANAMKGMNSCMIRSSIAISPGSMFWQGEMKAMVEAHQEACPSRIGDFKQIDMLRNGRDTWRSLVPNVGNETRDAVRRRSCTGSARSHPGRRRRGPEGSWCRSVSHGIKHRSLSERSWERSCTTASLWACKCWRQRPGHAALIGERRTTAERGTNEKLRW